MSSAQPIRNKHQVRETSGFYLKRDELRYHLLIVTSIHTTLRIGDLFA